MTPAFLSLVLLTVPPAFVEDDGEALVSPDELGAEISRRQEDIARTEYRIAAIATAQIAAREELIQARKDGEQVERMAVVRARALYRISRNGGSLRYLLGASSPVDLLKRLAELKRLLEQGLEARRQAGNRIANAERRVKALEEEKEAAYKMKDMLTDALAELETELAALAR